MDASFGVSSSLPYVRVGQSMSMVRDVNISREPAPAPEVWRVSSKPTIQESEPDVNVLGGDNQVDVGIRPDLENIRVNLCSCVVSLRCCLRVF